MGPEADPRRPEDFEARWRSRFEEFAEARDDDAGIAGWSVAGLDARVRQFRALWRPPPRGQQWLDAGCGAGTYSRLLQAHGLAVVGTDYSLPTLRHALRRTVEGIVYVVADVRRLPFRPASFDGALCLGVTQALAQSDEAVAALAGVVKPGGEVWIDALNRWCVHNAADLARRRLTHRRIHLRYEAPGTLLRLMRDAGFRDVRLHWLPLLPSRLKAFQGLLEGPLARTVLRFVPFAGRLLSHSFVVCGTRRGTEP